MPTVNQLVISAFSIWNDWCPFKQSKSITRYLRNALMSSSLDQKGALHTAANNNNNRWHWTFLQTKSILFSQLNFKKRKQINNEAFSLHLFQFWIEMLVTMIIMMMSNLNELDKANKTWMSKRRSLQHYNWEEMKCNKTTKPQDIEWKCNNSIDTTETINK